MESLELGPDILDVVQFGGIFRKPLDPQPVVSSGERLAGRLAGVDRAIVEHDNDRLHSNTSLVAIETVQFLQEGDEVSAARGTTCMDDQLAPREVKAPIMATFVDIPGAGTRRSAPRFAQARAR